MELLKNTFFLILGLAIVGWSFYAFLQKPVPEKYQSQVSTWLPELTHFPSGVDTLRIGEEVIQIEIADTDEKRARGLSGRAHLESGRGMLFIFDKLAIYSFWMKDMNFPIDIVWLASDWTVVGVERLVNPDTYPKVFYPPGAIKYVLELNSGEASRRGIDTGSMVYFDDQD